MRYSKVIVPAFIALAMIMVSGVSLVSAQPISTSVDIKFPFHVADKVFEAGTYTLDMKDNGTILLKGKSGSKIMMVLSVLGRHDKDTDAELVFDIVDGTYCLSEIWFPGKDGFLVLANQKSHEHAILGGSNSHQ